MKQSSSVADVNIFRILRFIWQHKDASRINIAKGLGLDKSTVSKIMNRLVEAGIVDEAEHGDVGVHGGRRPVFLKIAETFACVGGVEINPERFVCCLLDLNGVVLFQWQEAISPKLYKELGCTGVFFKAFELISVAAEKRGVPLAGIGVGIPGMVDSAGERIVQSVSLMIEEPCDVIKEISSHIDVPVYLENDARCCCFAEKLLVNSETMQNILFVLTEYRLVQPKINSRKNLSVGMGLVLNGNMYRGTENSAGEFRSILWDGSVGQFSSLVVSSDTGSDSAHNLPLDDKGASLDMVFHELACHIAFLVNVLNLDGVYIGGLDNALTEQLVALVHERTEFQWPYGIPRSYQIKSASLGQFAVSYGAAAMVLEDFFSLPSLNGVPRKMSLVLDHLNLCTDNSDCQE